MQMSYQASKTRRLKLADQATIKTEPIIEDLYKVSQKAEIVQGELVLRRGEMAEAEPAVPGWRIAVDELFE
jgi:hypothetical protein